MTVEEAKQLAQRGDVRAMMGLADYYAKRNNGENDIDNAFHYYELAASMGEPQAIQKMAQTSRMTADVAFSMIESEGRVRAMDEVAEKAFHWATKLDKVIRSLKISEPETVEFVKENLLISLARLATLYYIDKKYDDVLRISRDINHPYAQAIYGLAAYQVANTDSEIGIAFNALKSIENDVCWKKEFQTKFTQILLVEAAAYLSALYRIIYNDVDSAYRVFSCVATRSLDEAIRKDTREDMARHFKRKLFGGYSYVE